MNVLDFLTTNKEIVLLVVFFASLLTQLIYYTGIYSRFIFYKKPASNIEQEPVSVIICARNEADNLDINLPEILSQDYPKYEVIVVNDCSKDHTDEVLGKYLKKFNHLRTTSINEDKKFSHGKKLALTIGIKAAKYELLLLTDADCKPAGNQWISSIQRNFSDEKSIVLGYGGHYRKKGLLNNYIRYDTLVIALQYFSYALTGNPYMGVGRNLAYRKSLFFANKGFASHHHLLSGDDDLFISETANGTNTAIEFSHESHTRTNSETTLKGWVKQKRRHLTTAPRYRFKHKLMLGGESFSRLIYYTSFVLLTSFFPFSEYVTAAFGLRLTLQMISLKKAMKLLNEKNLLLSSLFYDIFSLFINFFLYISIRLRFKRRKQWK
ncbi:MAG: glycosyltransferase [Bacteroidales bacterium]|nr:glycosyltransferase [Bacteroidales bacterium]